MRSRFNWVPTEKQLPEKKHNEVRFSRDKPGSTGAKQFCHAPLTKVFHEPTTSFETLEKNAIFMSILMMNVNRKNVLTRKNIWTRSDLTLTMLASANHGRSNQVVDPKALFSRYPSISQCLAFAFKAIST